MEKNTAKQLDNMFSACSCLCIMFLLVTWRLVFLSVAVCILVLVAVVTMITSTFLPGGHKIDSSENMLLLLQHIIFIIIIRHWTTDTKLLWSFHVVFKFLVPWYMHCVMFELEVCTILCCGFSCQVGSSNFFIKFMLKCLI